MAGLGPTVGYSGVADTRLSPAKQECLAACGCASLSLPAHVAVNDCQVGTGNPHACSGRSVRLAADKLLERGFVADRIEVGVVLCGIAELLRHLDGVPEVIERVTRPAALNLAAGEVEEQHGVLRSGCDQGA